MWFKKCRLNYYTLMFSAMAANIGMWVERFVIADQSLSRDFLPSSWGYFSPTIVDITLFAGSFGLFLTMFLLFCRFLPMVAMAEIKSVLPQAHAHHGEHHAIVHGEKPADETQAGHGEGHSDPAH
jgi:molybdopterin-containing oxidoreductase family membrane subunit